MLDRSDPSDTKGLERGQIELVVKHCRDRRLVVQGGARIGVWPKALSSVFERVLTFEPDSANAECCLMNLAETKNVILCPMALAERTGIAMLRHSTLSGGEHYLEPSNMVRYGPIRFTKDYNGETPVQTIAIDDLNLTECSAMFLDVEGTELSVLKGARSTLERLKPVLCLEENQCGSRYGVKPGELAKWLEPYGYRCVDRWTTLPPEIQNDGLFRGADLIFA